MTDLIADQLYWIAPLWTFAAGLIFGSLAANRRWRQHGDHEHRNRIVSAGRHYEIKRLLLKSGPV